jgi:hypothetical protein
MASPAQKSSLKLFLEKNPNLKLVKEARDARSGIWKLLDAGIFGFLLFSPALPIIPTMEQPAVVGVLWVLIIAIMWCKIEYCHRAEVWYMCLYRGIIVDFPKTNKFKGWLCQPPMFLAYTFLAIFCVVTYIGLDPNFEFDSSEKAFQAILAVVGLLFVLLLTKAFVNAEGAPALLTLNMVIDVFQDPELLNAKGFKVVHFSCLQRYVKEKGAAKDTSFSWDDLHGLSSSADKDTHISLIGGTRMWLFLSPFKDVSEERQEKEFAWVA